MNQLPKNISVGIMSSEKISFCLKGKYQFLDKNYEGDFLVSFENQGLLYDGKVYDEIILIPLDYEKSCFELDGVIIGVDFHWQKKERQTFKGTLRLIVENNLVTAVNILDVEDYLKSVISSEMSATSYTELLKAHAVISRSWLLCQFYSNAKYEEVETFTFEEKDVLFVNRWYERDKHTNYDVCADDHCQRYQGITKITTNKVKEAVDATKGEVLVCDGEICDARFSKACGGVTESFDTCWADKHYKYLESCTDTENEKVVLDLTKESDAQKWIKSSEKAYCNVKDNEVLRQVLNNFDQTTTDFFRWKVVYSEQQLADIIKQRSGVDFGKILEIIPLKRGASGRISYLKIVGSKRVAVVGKELEIRKWLSKSHLYSSAFVVEKESTNFVFYGAGWGHGVGLCQIGAATMSKNGLNYRQILEHYYKNSNIKKLY